MCGLLPTCVVVNSLAGTAPIVSPAVAQTYRSMLELKGSACYSSHFRLEAAEDRKSVV